MRLYDSAYSGNCLKVRLLLGLLGRPCERVPIDIFAGDNLTDAYARINPAREVPALELDDGTVLVQSNAILWYLAEGTPLLPSTALGRAQTAQWLAFEQEWIMRGIAGARFRLLTGRPGGRERVALARQALDLLAAHVDGRAWVVGDAPSIADLSIYAYAHRAHEAEVQPPGPVTAWLERVEALPGLANDLEPYPDHARPGAGRSIYD
jgi:glutathione S-transferase